MDFEGYISLLWSSLRKDIMINKNFVKGRIDG